MLLNLNTGYLVCANNSITVYESSESRNSKNYHYNTDYRQTRVAGLEGCLLSQSPRVLFSFCSSYDKSCSSQTLSLLIFTSWTRSKISTTGLWSTIYVYLIFGIGAHATSAVNNPDWQLATTAVRSSSTVNTPTGNLQQQQCLPPVDCLA